MSVCPSVISLCIISESIASVGTNFGVGSEVNLAVLGLTKDGAE